MLTKHKIEGTNRKLRNTVASCIEGSRLNGIATFHFMQFKQVTELYERKVLEEEDNLEK